jgi:hypothetical protein
MLSPAAWRMREQIAAHSLAGNHLDFVPGHTVRSRENSRDGLCHGIAGDFLADQHAGFGILLEHDLHHVGIPASGNNHLDLPTSFSGGRTMA